MSETDEYLKPVTHRNFNLFSATAVTTAFTIMNVSDPQANKNTVN